MTVEVLYFAGCPHADAARELARRCVADLGVDATIVERDGDHASPSIRVDGVDVMGAPQVHGRACRLDVPTEARLMAALRGNR